jgi:hypothetical protein
MKVKELIKHLKKYNNLDDEIIVAYYSYADVCDSFDGFNQTHWQELVSRYADYEYDLIGDDLYSNAHEIINDG